MSKRPPVKDINRHVDKTIRSLRGEVELSSASLTTIATYTLPDLAKLYAKTIGAGREGNAAAYGTDAEKSARREAYQAECVHLI